MAISSGAARAGDEEGAIVGAPESAKEGATAEPQQALTPLQGAVALAWVRLAAATNAAADATAAAAAANNAAAAAEAAAALIYAKAPRARVARVIQLIVHVTIVKEHAEMAAGLAHGAGVPHTVALIIAPNKHARLQRCWQQFGARRVDGCLVGVNELLNSLS